MTFNFVFIFNYVGIYTRHINLNIFCMNIYKHVEKFCMLIKVQMIAVVLWKICTPLRLC